MRAPPHHGGSPLALAARLGCLGAHLAPLLVLWRVCPRRDEPSETFRVLLGGNRVLTDGPPGEVEVRRDGEPLQHHRCRLVHPQLEGAVQQLFGLLLVQSLFYRGVVHDSPERLRHRVELRGQPLELLEVLRGGARPAHRAERPPAVAVGVRPAVAVQVAVSVLDPGPLEGVVREGAPLLGALVHQFGAELVAGRHPVAPRPAEQPRVRPH
mmetsp:Transcript_100084/g.272035  ORF Transcript_100084/g.272035 Transcript_100084/m.272035 type:complete len:211 (-) Transcript_100084:2178-2810(-)